MRLQNPIYRLSYCYQLNQDAHLNPPIKLT